MSKTKLAWAAASIAALMMAGEAQAGSGWTTLDFTKLSWGTNYGSSFTQDGYTFSVKSGNMWYPGYGYAALGLYIPDVLTITRADKALFWIGNTTISYSGGGSGGSYVDFNMTPFDAQGNELAPFQQGVPIPINNYSLFGPPSASPFSEVRLDFMGGGGYTMQSIDLAAAVPEPSEWALMAGGLALIGAISRRKYS